MYAFIEIVTFAVCACLVLPPAVIELLPFHRAEPNEPFEFLHFRFEQIVAGSQNVVEMKPHHAVQYS